MDAASALGAARKEIDEMKRDNFYKQMIVFLVVMAAIGAVLLIGGW